MYIYIIWYNIINELHICIWSSKAVDLWGGRSIVVWYVMLEVWCSVGLRSENQSSEWWTAVWMKHWCHRRPVWRPTLSMEDMITVALSIKPVRSACLMSPSMIESGAPWTSSKDLYSVSHWGRSFLWIMPSVTAKAWVAAMFCDDLSPYEMAQIWVGRTRSFHWIMKVSFWVPREDLAAAGAGPTYTLYASRSPINVLISKYPCQ